MCKITDISKRPFFQLNLFDCLVKERKTEVLPSWKDTEISSDFLTFFI